MTIIKAWLIINAIVLWLAFHRCSRGTGVSNMPLYHKPIGVSHGKPDVAITPIDRVRLVTNAHAIATRFRPRLGSYREALAYGFRTAWEQGRVAQSFAMLRAQVKPREWTAKEIADSRAATRRVGSSFT